MVAAAPRLDDLFGALADPTRRAIVERLLARGEQAVGSLAKPFAISLPAISRHLRILEETGLIEREARAQYRVIRAKPEALAAVENWVARQRDHWNAALDRLDAALAADTRKRSKS